MLARTEGRTPWEGNHDARCHRNGMPRRAAATSQLHNRYSVENQAEEKKSWHIAVYLFLPPPSHSLHAAMCLLSLVCICIFHAD